MGREAEGAQQDVEVTAGDGELLRNAQAVQPHHRQRHAEQQRFGGFLFHQQPRDGHNDDVQRRDEARLAGSGGLQALLLEVGGHRQGHTAAQAADQQVPDRLAAAPAQLSAHQAQRQQKAEGHRRPGRVEGEGLHIVRAHALRHEGRAPDQRRQQRHPIMTNLFRVHFSCSQFSSMI